ncbi:MAG TPA: hypothetical protein VNS88_17310, partial [Nitrospiraceae bacterium]|nr:hypothetical protein [Nitrospiraceae bacterium]
MPLFSSPNEISAPTLGSGGEENLGTYLSGMVKSGIESFPELIGIPPSDETLNWRMQNPVGGFLSGMISPIPEFGLAAKIGTTAVKMIPKLRALEEASPVIGGILKGTLGMGGVDAARIAGSMLVGGDTSNVIQSSIIDTAMQAGLGGVGGLLAKYGPANKIAPTFGTENLDGPLQVRARELQAKIEGGGVPQEQLQAAKDQLATWGQAIRGETGRQARPVQGFMTRPMVDTLGEMSTPVNSDNKQLNRLFAIPKLGETLPGEGPATLKKRLISGPGNFSDEATLAKVTGDANLPVGYEYNGQHFRHISFTNQGAAANINKVVKNNMLDVGDGWYLAKEQDPGLVDGVVSDTGGLYVMAKKVGGPNKFVSGKPVGNAADQWIIFKTDKPGFFKPEGQKFSDTVSRNAWDPMEDPARQKAIQDYQYTNLLDKVNEGTPLRIYQSGPTGFLGMGPKASPAKWVEGLGRVFTKVQGWGDGGYALDTAKAFLTEHVSPTMFQFAGNPLARKIYTGLRTAFDIGDADTLRAMHGEVGPLEGNLWKHAISGGQRQGGIAPMFKALTDAELEEYNKVFSEQKYRVMTPEELQKNLNVSPKVAALHGALQENDLRNWTGVNTANRLSGEEEPLKHLAGHMGISRTWEGDFRVPVYSETGDMVSMGAGKDRATAIRNAKNLVDEAAAQGKKWIADPKVKLHDVWDDVAATKQLKTRSAEEWSIIDAAESKGRPGFFKRRKGVGGYEGERGFTRQEFIDKITQHDAAMSKLQSQAAFNTIYGKQMEALSEQAPGLHRQMNERLHQLMGHQG